MFVFDVFVGRTSCKHEHLARTSYFQCSCSFGFLNIDVRGPLATTCSLSGPTLPALGKVGNKMNLGHGINEHIGKNQCFLTSNLTLAIVRSATLACF